MDIDDLLMSTKRRRLLELSGAVLASLTWLADNDEIRGHDAIPREIARQSALDDPDTVSQLVGANTTFAFDLFEALSAENPHENQFVSPLSISSALAMMWAGARAETEREMADVLRFPPLGQNDVHPAFRTLLGELNERGDIDVGEDELIVAENDHPAPIEADELLELTIANALWGREGLEFREEFLQVLMAYYDAAFQQLDFEGAPEESRELINAWIEDRTGGHLRDVIPPEAIDAQTALVLANAIYFSAGWRHPFNEEATRDETFTALDGSTDDVAMMRKFDEFRYAEVDSHQVIQLPYIGWNLSMIVVLPAEGEYETFEQTLTGDAFTDLLDELEFREGRLELPRFQIGSELHLNETLSTLGMGSAFDPETADFGGAVERDELWIGHVIHSTFIAVDEEGTEAAAVTVIIDEDVEAAPDEDPPEPFEMVADRPFLFAIRDRPTDTVLFLGRVVDVPEDPEQA